MIENFNTKYGSVTVKNVMIGIDSDPEEGIEIVSQDDSFEMLLVVGYNVLDLTTEELERLIEDSYEEKPTKKKFKVGYYFESEIEVLAYEGDHERIAQDGCDATLDFHAGEISNAPDEEGLTDWDVPYHKEFKIVRPIDSVEVMVMGAIILIKMNKGESYIPEVHHKQIAEDLQEDTLEGTLYNDSYLYAVGSWEIKYRE